MHRSRAKNERFRHKKDRYDFFSYLKCTTENRIDVAFIFITGQNIKWCFIDEFINGMRI